MCPDCCCAGTQLAFEWTITREGMLSIAVALLERTVRDRLESTALRQALSAAQVGSQSGTATAPAVHGKQHTLSLLLPCTFTFTRHASMSEPLCCHIPPPAETGV
jgi:hypothetical protein